MAWRNKRIAGVEYDLSHLGPMSVTVIRQEAAAVPITVNVSFGAHTFTRDLEATDTPDFHVRDGRTIRCFCTNRHQHSAMLPGLVQAAAAGGMTYFGQGGRMLLRDNSHGPQRAVLRLLHDGEIQKCGVRFGHDCCVGIHEAKPAPVAQRGFVLDLGDHHHNGR